MAIIVKEGYIRYKGKSYKVGETIKGLPKTEEDKLIAAKVAARIEEAKTVNSSSAAGTVANNTVTGIPTTDATGTTANNQAAASGSNTSTTTTASDGTTTPSTGASVNASEATPS